MATWLGQALLQQWDALRGPEFVVAKTSAVDVGLSVALVVMVVMIWVFRERDEPLTLEPAPRSKRLDTHTSKRQPLAGALWTAQAVVSEGVPEELAETVVSFANRVGSTQGGPKPMADPMTLMRFLNARELDEDQALEMYDGTIQWRREYSMPQVMTTFGRGATYAREGHWDEAADNGEWHWRMHTAATAVHPDTKIAANIGYFGRLRATTSFGEPVAVWRVGLVDLAGISRENLVHPLTRAFVSHLEDLSQFSRAATQKQKKLIRARLVIDVKGLGLSTLQYISVIKLIMSLGKSYFPEVTASATVVRAPWFFARIYSVISPMLNPVMRRKVNILGDDFEAGLLDHAGLKLDVLPEFLGGQTPDDQVFPVSKVPVGMRQKYEEDCARFERQHADPRAAADPSQPPR